MKSQMIFQRYEFKYRMYFRQLQTVLAAMTPYMVPDEYSHSSIRNLYLDTPDFRLIRRSLEGPVYTSLIVCKLFAPTCVPQGWAPSQHFPGGSQAVRWRPSACERPFGPFRGKAG